MKKYSIDEIIHIINQEMNMYDDLDKYLKFEKDRAIVSHKWKALESLIQELKKYR